jgi:hypothetical protein
MLRSSIAWIKSAEQELAGADRAYSKNLGGWERVGDIPDFPFDDFEQMQAAAAARSFNVGVDPLAAAEWSARSGSRTSRAAIALLSLLLISAGVAAVIAAFVIKDYWLLASIPVQMILFYISHPAFPLHKWATIAGAITPLLFISLLFNGQTTAATLAAYAGLTFAAVRAAAFISNSSFRKALLVDETLFLSAFNRRSCTLRNNNTGRIYTA